MKVKQNSQIFRSPGFSAELARESCLQFSNPVVHQNNKTSQKRACVCVWVCHVASATVSTEFRSVLMWFSMAFYNLYYIIRISIVCISLLPMHSTQAG